MPLSKEMILWTHHCSSNLTPRSLSWLKSRLTFATICEIRQQSIRPSSIASNSYDLSGKGVLLTKIFVQKYNYWLLPRSTYSSNDRLLFTIWVNSRFKVPKSATSPAFADIKWIAGNRVN